MVPVPTESAPPSRTLFVSQRGRSYERPRALLFTFEDLIAGIEGASVIAPEGNGYGLGARLYRRFPKLLAPLLGPPPALDPGTELVFVGMQGLGDVGGLLPVFHRGNPDGLLVAFIEELWKDKWRRCPGEIEALKRCDFVFVGCAGSVEALSAAIDRPCAHLPPSVDALRFDPFPRGLERSIDVFGMGRRDEMQHDQLRSWARDEGRFYLYDTLDGIGSLKDHWQHREHFIELVQRSRYFIVNPAKLDESGHTGGQQEVGFRYYEGAAGGAVLIGDRSNSEVFERQFSHQDAVISVHNQEGGLPALIEELDAQPARLERIRRMNVANILRNHDHAHRWADVLAALDLASNAALTARLIVLAERATELESTTEAPVSGLVS
jgi:glycosyl transferase family 1